MFIPDKLFNILSSLLVDNKKASDGIERGITGELKYTEKDMQIGMLRAQRETVEHLFTLSLHHNVKLQEGSKK